MNGRTRRNAWIASGVVFVVALAVVGVWREIDGDGHSFFTPGFDEVVSDEELPAKVLLAGGDWVLEQSSYQTFDQDGAPGVDEPCVRVRIGDRATMCVSIRIPDGASSAGVVRAPDGRNFVQFFADPSVATIRLFTSTRRGETLTPVATDDARSGVVTVVELGEGEEPWGLQAFDASGDLIQVQTLVGFLR